MSAGLRIRPDFAVLRRRAESFLQEQEQEPQEASPREGALGLVHELNVCQVELELQNDELRRAQEDLAKARDDFADLFHMAPVGYLTLGGDGTVLQANRRAAELLGLAQQEVGGRLFARLLSDHEAERAYYKWRTDVMRNADVGPVDLDLARMGENRFVARLQGRRHGTQMWLTLEDVTAPKAVEGHTMVTAKVLQSLTNAERAKDALVEVCDAIRQGMRVHGVGVRLQDGEDYPYYTTRGFPPEFTETESSLVLDGSQGLLPQASGAPVLACLCGCVLGQQLDTAHPGCTPAGSFFSNRGSELLTATTHHNCQHAAHGRCFKDGYESIALVPIKCTGEVLGLLQLIDPRPRLFSQDDIAFLERLANSIGLALAKQLAEEKRLTVELQMLQAQKLESLGVLVGGIAHDFNNLLTPMLGNAQVVLLGLERDSSMRGPLEDIERAATVAAQLVQRMLVYGGRASVERRPTGLNELVEQMCPLLERTVSKQTSLQCGLGQDLPVVTADAAQLRQVIMNLVINGAEALGDTPGSVRIETGVQTLNAATLKRLAPQRTFPPGRYVFLRVTDCGCGMDRETLGKIFDPFYSTKFAGRGLGLAAVSGIVASHEGVLQVESTPSHGTVFTMFLPTCDGQAMTKTSEAQLSPPRLRRATVLLVDDEPIVLGFLRRVLEQSGYNVFEASNGEQAVAVFAAHTDDIDCVLLDYTMPGMDGEETFEQLRKLREDVRVVLCSGYGAEFLAERRVAIGLAGFLPKPCPVGVLLAKLDEVLGS